MFLDRSPNSHPQYYIYTMLKKKVETWFFQKNILFFLLKKTGFHVTVNSHHHVILQYLAVEGNVKTVDVSVHFQQMAIISIIVFVSVTVILFIICIVIRKYCTFSWNECHNITEILLYKVIYLKELLIWLYHHWLNFHLI